MSDDSSEDDQETKNTVFRAERLRGETESNAQSHRMFGPEPAIRRFESGKRLARSVGFDRDAPFVRDEYRHFPEADQRKQV